MIALRARAKRRSEGQAVPVAAHYFHSSMIELNGVRDALATLTASAPRFYRAPGRLNLIGDHVDYSLAPGETLQVQTGHLVAFEPTVNYDIQMVGNIRTAIFGGEGLFLTTLTGPGRVILQSMTLERLRHELAPAEHRGSGQEMSNPLGVLASGNLGAFFGSDE